jgi:hypothetical protein
MRSCLLAAGPEALRYAGAGARSVDRACKRRFPIKGFLSRGSGLKVEPVFGAGLSPFSFRGEPLFEGRAGDERGSYLSRFRSWKGAQT